MLSLPTEVQLDVLKCLNYNQVLSVKQTNFYFRNLINKYEGELALVKFKKFSIIGVSTIKQKFRGLKIIKPNSEFVEYKMSDRQKWQIVKDKSILPYLRTGWNYLFNRIEHFTKHDKEFAIYLEKTEKYKTHYILKFPNFPKNMYEMVNIRYCFEQLFKCNFESVLFDEIIFNPEFINLLFGDNKKFSLHIQTPILSANGHSFENIWKFSLNCLEISECLRIYFDSISTQHFDIISNILIKEGKKLPKVNFRFNNTEQQYLQLCDFIVQVSCPNFLKKIFIAAFVQFNVHSHFIRPMKSSSHTEFTGLFF
uniref:F-box domain-containing protein n=1 Tax=Meloidogyne incognita TaxID=6306 RepID=A0A914LS57_MELIC